MVYSPTIFDAAGNFIDAYLADRKARHAVGYIEHQLQEMAEYKSGINHSGTSLVKDKCSSCGAPNENSTANCEYCNSNLKLFPATTNNV